MPGTQDEHPNWRRKLASDLDAIAAPGGAAREARGRDGGGRPRHAPERRPARRAAAARDLPSPVPQGLHLRRCGSDRALSRAARRSAMSTPRRSTGRGRARPTATTSSTIARSTPSSAARMAFYRLSDALRQHGLGLVLDIVPNHMGVGGADNPGLALDARMGRALARRAGLRHRLGAARRQPQARRALPRRPLRRRPRQGRAEACLGCCRRLVQRLALRAPVPDLPVELPHHPRPGARRARRDRHRELGSPSRRERAPAHHVGGDGPGAPDRLSRGGRGAESPDRRSRRRARRACGSRSNAPSTSSTAPPAFRKASGRSTASSRRNPTGSPIGAWRRATSTIVVSSTSTASPGCASRSPRSSPARTKRCSASSAKAGSTGCASIISMGSPTPPPMSRRCNGRSGRGSTSSSRRSSSRAKRCGAGRSPAPPATTP